MSAKLLRGHLGPIAGFPWQRPGSADSTAHGDVSVGACVLDVHTADIHREAGGGLRGGHNAETSTAHALPFQQQLDTAHHELEELRSQMQREVKAAHHQGVQDGQRAAEQRLSGEVTAMRAQLLQSLTEVARARQDVLAHADGDLVRLAVAIAEKVLNRQLQTDPDALRGIVHAALERLAGRAAHAVRMHPGDIEIVDKALREVQPTGFRLLPDPTLPKGSLLFDTDFGVLDASIATQLEEIERGLADRLQRSSP